MKAILIAISAAAALFLSSCGGTFVLAPDGTLSYTTPVVIVPEAAK